MSATYCSKELVNQLNPWHIPKESLLSFHKEILYEVYYNPLPLPYHSIYETFNELPKSQII